MPVSPAIRLLLLTFPLVVLGLAVPALGRPPAGEAVQAHLAAVEKRYAAEADSLLAVYTDLHTNPELSLAEVRTAAKLAAELEKLGFKVTTRVGATGVVGVLENGKGPTVLVRTDMDALPVVERTGLAYASKQRTRDRSGNEVGVMHACGHDVHMTVWTGTARVLTALKDRWKGTLVFVAQPAEEIGTGARLMVEAGLFTKFPKPDYCLALHCDSERACGTVAFTEGLAMANVDSVDITVRGKGGHGAAPHTTVDPVVLAARIVLDLQTLVSREIRPTDPAVVTVGSIHGGAKHNIIPDEVKLQLTVRSTKASVRQHLLAGIKRIAEACAAGANAPPPVVKVDESEFTPALYNDPALTRRTAALFREVLGDGKVEERPAMMGGEDFSRYARSGAPIFLFWLGTVAPERVAQARKEEKPLPSLHSDRFAPVPAPTLHTGVKTMSMAVLNLLGR
ncbi:MAG: amidohydrolase [Gemmataceae bacterium]